ncbi:MAG TPA: hypothetical protein VK184_25030 [Nostocaceae cyanobacterium]|nr:hypothetical protein [Nostocaceae cyanobacterium]
MAKLKINELQVTGAELFADAETFLNDLSEDELKGAMGGRVIYPYTTLPYQATYSPLSPYSPVIL